MGHGDEDDKGQERAGRRDVQPSMAAIWRQLQAWALEEGFSQIGVADVDLGSAEDGFLQWLQAGFAGRMDYMHAHGLKRLRPAELVPGTVRVITARMDYLPRDVGAPEHSPVPSTEPTLATPADWREREGQRLRSPHEAVISVYARGRDYHKVLRGRLARLARRLQDLIGPFGHRAFTDSAPVAEVELAARSGLGWRGKHTLLLNRQGGSMFFLGELFVDLPLPLTDPVEDHCGQCSACLQACPTGAIVAPYRLDARRCISYLTIEEPGPIAPELREAMGNRLYGCDDCQLTCPWNKYAQPSRLPDFDTRPAWRSPMLLNYWQWNEQDFERHTEGTAIRRIGFERWQRNLAVVSGNALRAVGEAPADADRAFVQALQHALVSALETARPLVAEHLVWALEGAGKAPSAQWKPWTPRPGEPQ